MRAALLAFACVILSAPGVARASCGGPFDEWGPPSGSVVPPNPHIFAFIPSGFHGGTFSSPEAPLAAREVAVSDAFHVYALTVHATRGIVTVHYDYTDDKYATTWSWSASYRIGAAVPNTAELAGFSYEVSSWMCSFTNAVRLDVHGNAIALRLDYHDGHGPTIVPTDEPLVGHVSCIGSTAYVDTLREFDLVALFADGTERHLGTASLRVDLASIRLPVELDDPDDRALVMPIPWPPHEPRTWRELAESLAPNRADCVALAWLFALTFGTAARLFGRRAR